MSSQHTRRTYGSRCASASGVPDRGWVVASRVGRPAVALTIPIVSSSAAPKARAPMPPPVSRNASAAGIERVGAAVAFVTDVAGAAAGEGTAVGGEVDTGVPRADVGAVVAELVVVDALDVEVDGGAIVPAAPDAWLAHAVSPLASTTVA